MQLHSLLGSEPGLTLIGALFGAAWTFFRSTDWYRRHSALRHAEALECLEAAVEATYREYVEALKAASADGRLTPDERAQARGLARQRALAIATSRGVDLLREIGEDALDLWIARLVRKLKR
jgi:hypothetical protein